MHGDARGAENQQQDGDIDHAGRIPRQSEDP